MDGVAAAECCGHTMLAAFAEAEGATIGSRSATSTGSTVALSPSRQPEPAPAAGAEASVVLLGVAGGPPPVAGQAGIASAVVAGDGVYLVDAGRGALNQFMNAGLSMASLKGIFLTHMHQDHTANYFEILLLGNRIRGIYDVGFESLSVYGPRPGGPPPFLPPLETPYAADDPYPGVIGLTEASYRAQANALNNFLAVGAPDLREVVKLYELPPAEIQGSPENPAPPITPFPVFEDGNVRVTATLVPHGIYPSLGFRFDTDAGSIVFSGDTKQCRDNLVEIARGADVLVHEVYDREGMVEQGFPSRLVDTFRGGHTEAEEVGIVAQDAGVERLVLNHLIPAGRHIVPDERWIQKAQQGYGGHVILGDDLMRVDLAHT